MKKFLIILLLGILAPITASSQSIANVLVAPPNPTADDSITVITAATFNTDAYSVINQVYIDTATHTINIQLFKCAYSNPPGVLITDTFRLGQLAVASWSLNVMLFTAQYNNSTSTCGTFSMSDTENSTIVVSAPGPVTGIGTTSPRMITLYPNPAKNIVHFTSPDNAPAQLHILNLQGQQVLQAELQNDTPVSIAHLLPGLYLYTLESTGQTTQGKLVIANE